MGEKSSGNVVEFPEGEDPVAEDPARWEVYSGPPPKFNAAGKLLPNTRMTLPPGPPDENARAVAAAARPLTAEDAEAEADRLEAQAALLRETAKKTKAAVKAGAKKKEGGPATEVAEASKGLKPASGSPAAAPAAAPAEPENGEEEDEDEDDELDDMTVTDLREKAKEAGVTGYSAMTKDQLVKEIRKAEDA